MKMTIKNIIWMIETTEMNQEIIPSMKDITVNIAIVKILPPNSENSFFTFTSDIFYSQLFKYF